MTQQCEALRLQSYQDSAGVWTIGWGHTGKDIGPGVSITTAQAIVLLRSDIAASEACVNQAVTVAMTQGQFDALVDFTFNVGRTNFQRSTLLKCVNEGKPNLVPDQFNRWIFAGNEVVPGLVNRRKAEIALWQTTTASSSTLREVNQ